MKKSLRFKIMPGITMALFALLVTTLVNAQSTQETYSSTTSRVGFFLGGGFAHSESRGGMIDLKSELQFGLSKKIRLGLGIGYMSDFHGMHMSGGMMGGMNNSFSGHRHSFRVVPITLSIYYLVPLSPKVDVFMTGGGGYYIASFRDVSTENKNAFGPHVGIGFDFKAAHKISIITEAVYRFVNLKDFTSQLHQGFRELEGEQHEDGFWHFHHQHEEWHFHEEHEDEIQVLEDSSPFNISLNGFSIRAGVRFGF